jgi:hypothetical protein
MKTTAKLLTLTFFVLFSFQCFAQEIELKGKVVTYDSIAVNKAKIHISSSQKEVFTNAQGEFTLICKSKDKLAIIADGFQKHKLKINAKVKSPLTINLEVGIKKHSTKLAIKSGHVLDTDNFLKSYSISIRNTKYGRFETVFDLLLDETKSARGNRRIFYEGGELRLSGYSAENQLNDVAVEVDGKLEDDNIIETLDPNTITHIDIYKGRRLGKYSAMKVAIVVVILTTKYNG